MQNLKTVIAATVAAITIIGFSAFKMTENKEGKPLVPVMIYFHGDPEDPTEVANESLWTTTPNGQSCNNVDLKACAQIVDHTDLTSSGSLDPNKIDLDAIATEDDNYIPDRVGGTSDTEFNPINRN